MYAVYLPLNMACSSSTHFHASQFINSAAGADKASVRHALSTSDLTVRSYTVHNHHMKDPGNVRSKVVLVDTPGLNNAKYSDTEIIKSIAAWLNDK